MNPNEKLILKLLTIPSAGGEMSCMVAVSKVSASLAPTVHAALGITPKGVPYFLLAQPAALPIRIGDYLQGHGKEDAVFDTLLMAISLQIVVVSCR
jgi:hypothetical protein